MLIGFGNDVNQDLRGFGPVLTRSKVLVSFCWIMGNRKASKSLGFGRRTARFGRA